ncbi:unnamed protein product, partial [marine sediment metagenome]
ILEYNLSFIKYHLIFFNYIKCEIIKTEISVG